MRNLLNMIERICYAKGCRCKSTSSYYIPRLSRYAYLCVKCGPKVIQGTKDLKARCSCSADK